MVSECKRLVVGEKYGSWTVVQEVGIINSHLSYLCRCVCGTTKVVSASGLRLGRRKGCRACAPARFAEKHVRHGHFRGGVRSPEYLAWESMKQRCLNPKGAYYGRFTVCNEWVGPDGFERFFSHVGPRPSSQHTLDRIDNDRGYEPGNVRWATMREQARNRRDTKFLTIGERTLCVTDWAKVSGIKRKTIYERLRRGWEPERAVYGNLSQ